MRHRRETPRTKRRPQLPKYNMLQHTQAVLTYSDGSSASGGEVCNRCCTAGGEAARSGSETMTARAPDDPLSGERPAQRKSPSPEIIRLAVMMYIRFPLSLRNIEDLLHERGIDICHETVRYWWNRFGPMFAREIRKKRIHPSANYSNWRWHLDEVFVKINGETH